MDRKENWEIAPISFKNLTLLVGASGVGKTKILQSIINMQKIANGSSINGVEWKIDFSINNDNYSWEGRFELKNKGYINFITEDENNDNNGQKPNLLFEQISTNGSILVKKEDLVLSYRGEISHLPLSSEQSALVLFNKDLLIENIQKEFKKILFSDYTDSAKGMYRGKYIDDQVLTKYKTFDTIRNSEEDLLTKFYWVFKKNKKLFSQIEDDFIQVFPQVEKLKLEPLAFLKNSNASMPLRLTPFVQFKERDMADWIPIMNMSAGMFRALIHIIELYLSADGTIILIDEFENSLGVNCIDELTNEIKVASNRIQFIITSHHPYIINSINYNDWKIVTRKGGKVFTQDVKDFNFHKSKHEAFIQLINLPEYKTGLKAS
jgi:predicted ATPase